MQIYILGIIDLLKKDDIEGTPDFLHGMIQGLDNAKLEIEKLIKDFYEVIRMLEEDYIDRKNIVDSIKSYSK